MKADLLRSIYEDIYGPLDPPVKPGKSGKKMANLRELAATLSKIAGREKPWTYRYLNSLLNGDPGFRVTPELETALQVLADKRDGAHPLKARLVEVTVFSINGSVKPGSIVTGKSERCACSVLFVRHHPRQKYCSKDCPARPRR